MNTLTFRQIFSIAAFAGLFAGLILTAVQQMQVIPTIVEAETYEQVGDVLQIAPHDLNSKGIEEAWKPDDGFERTLLTDVTQ